MHYFLFNRFVTIMEAAHVMLDLLVLIVKCHTMGHKV